MSLPPSDKSIMADEVSITSDRPVVHVKDYLQCKLDRNNLFIKFLETHNKLLKKEILISYRTCLINDKKIKMFKSANEFELKQLESFKPELEDTVRDIYFQINKMPLDGADELFKDVTILRKECMSLQEQLNNSNKKIPKTLDIMYTS
jgi:hypothetical protein